MAKKFVNLNITTRCTYNYLCNIHSGSDFHISVAIFSPLAPVSRVVAIRLSLKKCALTKTYLLLCCVKKGKKGPRKSFCRLLESYFKIIGRDIRNDIRRKRRGTKHCFSHEEHGVYDVVNKMLCQTFEKRKLFLASRRLVLRLLWTEMKGKG